MKMPIQVYLTESMADGSVSSELVFEGDRDDFLPSRVALDVNFYLRVARDERKALEIVRGF